MNFFRSFYIFLPLLFAFPSFLSAQKNFKPATVTLLNGVVLNGEINYKNWTKNPDKIHYRENGSKEKIFDVSQISDFSVEGDKYIRAVVDVDIRHDDIRRLSNNAQIETKRDTLFLQLVVNGDKSLYYYRDQVDHFYIRNNNAITLLQYKKHTADTKHSGSTGLNAVRENRQYLAQLNNYFEDCSTNQKSLQKTKYTLNSLLSSFKAYYSCKSSVPEFEIKNEKPKSDFGIIAGVSRTNISVKNADGAIIGKVNYSTSTDVTGGLFFDLTLPRNRSRLSINNELMYTSYESTGMWRSGSNDMNYNTETFTIGYSYLKLNNMFRYKIYQGGLTIFANAGFSNGFAISEKNEVVVFQKSGATETSTTYPAHPSTKKHEFGLLIGAGLRKNKLSLELRGEKTNGSFVANNVKLSTRRYSALLSYRF